MFAAYYSNRRKKLCALHLAILKQADLLNARGHKNRHLTMGEHNGLAIDLREGIDQHRRQEALIFSLNILAKELHALTV
jgi:deoxyribodipyrimidine photolyase-like uncharacterized protein